MHGHRMRAVAALPPLCAALMLAGCGGSGASGTGSTATGAALTRQSTPSPPPPITAAERSWLKAVHHYDRRLLATISETSIVTSGSLTRSRDLDDSCKGMLRRAGPPGRFQAVQPMVHGACATLHKAALQLRHALATGLISGAVIEDADIADFSKALNGAYAKEGRATNMLARALAKADRIKRRFGGQGA